MGQADNDRSEVAAARARMTDIAVELAHRAEPDHLKELAKEKGEELKTLAKDKAQEQLVEMKDLAKEKAMQKTYEMKDRFIESRSRPYVGALIGASLGWLAFQKLFGKRRLERKFSVGLDPITPYTERSYTGDTGLYDAGYVGTSEAGYSATGGYSEDFYGVDQPSSAGIAMEGSDENIGLRPEVEETQGVIASKVEGAKDAVHNAKEGAKDAVHNAKEKVSDAAMNAKDKVVGIAGSVRDRMPAPAEIRERSSIWYHRGIQEQPLLFALGAVALGMLASMLIPVSNRERQLVHPAKKRVMEPAIAKAQAAIENLGHMAEEKLSPPMPEQQQSAIIQSPNEQPAPLASVAGMKNDPMAKDEFGLGIPDPQTYPSRH